MPGCDNYDPKFDSPTGLDERIKPPTHKAHIRKLMKTTKGKLIQLMALYAKATPGPWRARTQDSGKRQVVSGGDPPTAGVALCGLDLGEEWPATVNATLIAEMHEALPDLVSDLNEAREKLEAAAQDVLTVMSDKNAIRSDVAAREEELTRFKVSMSDAVHALQQREKRLRELVEESLGLVDTLSANVQDQTRSAVRDPISNAVATDYIRRCHDVLTALDGKKKA
jgi:hypothetical protein